MDAGETRQGRKAATVNLMFLVPSGRLTGALTAAREPTWFVEPGCTIIFQDGWHNNIKYSPASGDRSNSTN